MQVSIHTSHDFLLFVAPRKIGQLDAERVASRRLRHTRGTFRRASNAAEHAGTVLHKPPFAQPAIVPQWLTAYKAAGPLPDV